MCVLQSVCRACGVGHVPFPLYCSPFQPNVAALSSHRFPTRLCPLAGNRVPARWAGVTRSPPMVVGVPPSAPPAVHVACRYEPDFFFTDIQPIPGGGTVQILYLDTNSMLNRTAQRVKQHAGLLDEVWCPVLANYLLRNAPLPAPPHPTPMTAVSGLTHACASMVRADAHNARGKVQIGQELGMGAWGRGGCPKPWAGVVRRHPAPPRPRRVRSLVNPGYTMSGSK